MPERGLLFIANEAETEDAGCGCSLLGVGVVFLGAALYGVFGDGSLKPGSMLAYGFFGGSILAILVGWMMLASNAERAKNWIGFAVHPDGVSQASARREEMRRADRASLAPAEPDAADEREPAFTILLTQAAETKELALTLVSYWGSPVMSVRGEGGLWGRLPDGQLDELPGRIEGGDRLLPLAEALKETCPALPVTVVVAPEQVERKESRAVFDPVANIREHFADKEELKRRERLAALLDGEVGASLTRFCEEHGWTITATG